MFQGVMEKWTDPNNKDDRLLIEFYIDKIKMEALMRKAMEEKGDTTPIYEDREFIRIRIPGDNTATIERQVREDDKTRFAEQYKRFKANANQQYVGMPLSEWAIMTPSRVKMLEFHNIYTVQHMANASDTVIQKLGMDGPSLRREAQALLFKTQGAVDPEKEKMRRQLEEQAGQLALMQAQMAQIAAAQQTGVVATPAPAPAKRKGGRPSNAEIAAREAAKSEAA